jgi:hypothetical protein
VLKVFLVNQTIQNYADLLNSDVGKVDGSEDYLSVQEGIDNAADGDTVLIKPGTRLY